MNTKIIAAAVAGVFAVGVAVAADVNVYGKVDIGVHYKNVEHGEFGGSTDTFSMESGQNSASRIGIKGTEDLGNGTIIGFQLEQGFNADSGEFADDDRAFSREARMFVHNSTYGELSVGRMGALDSGNGTYGLMGSAGAFGTGWGTVGANTTILYGMSGGRFDNTITYKSPEFGGVNLYGQMSLKQDAKEDGKETSSEVNRYYAVGMTGRFGAADVGATFAITDYANTEYSELAEDNGYALTGYYRHNLGEITPVIAVQWFDHAKQSRFDDDGKPVTLVSETAGADGFGVVGGATMEIGGGTAMMQVGYRRAEYSTPMFANGYNKAWDAVQTAVGYEYSLSKRTKVYGGAGYTWEEQHGVWTSDKRAAEVVTGMVHSF